MAQAELRVSVEPAPPFAIVDETTGSVEGFSVDLIREVARRLDPLRPVVIEVRKDLASHLEAVADHEVDLGIAATTITADRENDPDFTQPFFRSKSGPARSKKVRGAEPPRTLAECAPLRTA